MGGGGWRRAWGVGVWSHGGLPGKRPGVLPDNPYCGPNCCCCGCRCPSYAPCDVPVRYPVPWYVLGLLFRHPAVARGHRAGPPSSPGTRGGDAFPTPTAARDTLCDPRLPGQTSPPRLVGARIDSPMLVRAFLSRAFREPPELGKVAGGSEEGTVVLNLCTVPRRDHPIVLSTGEERHPPRWHPAAGTGTGPGSPGRGFWLIAGGGARVGRGAGAVVAIGIPARPIAAPATAPRGTSPPAGGRAPVRGPGCRSPARRPAANPAAPPRRPGARGYLAGSSPADPGVPTPHPPGQRTPRVPARQWQQPRVTCTPPRAPAHLRATLFFSKGRRTRHLAHRNEIPGVRTAHVTVPSHFGPPPH